MVKLAELELIRHIRSLPAARPGLRSTSVPLGIGDDCAILRPPRGHEVLVTTDFSLEGRHFLRELHSADSVGHRTLARGLSDLAAMGARPLAAFLSLALPGDLLSSPKGRKWIARFLSGFNALAVRHSVPLAGGDTSQSPSPHILADIVLLGSAPPGKALRRSTARPGDLLFVTGQLGGSAAELAALQRRGRLSSIRAASDLAGSNPHPHLFPQPRLAIGQTLLRRKLATACIDLSDGLSTDLTHLCSESGLGAELNAADIPLHPLAAAAATVDGSDPLSLALHGGEDYELLFTAPPSTRVPRAIAGVSITRIGRMTRGKGVTLVLPQGRRSPLPAAGWEHFRR